MNTVSKYLALLCVCFCLCVGVSAQSSAASNTSIKTVNEDQLVAMLEPHSGKIVILNFFATWCPPCKKEIPGLVALRKKYGKDKVFIVGLSVDKSAAPLKKFVRDMGIDYPVVRAGSDVTRLFNVQSIPHNVVFDQNVDIVVNAAGFVSEDELTRLMDDLLGR